MLLVALDMLLYWFLEWCQPAAEVGPMGPSQRWLDKIKVNGKESNMRFGRRSPHPLKTNVNYPKIAIVERRCIFQTIVFECFWYLSV